MNNTIETNQNYQKFKEILTARQIISRWLSAGSVLLHQVISLLLLAVNCHISQPATQWLLFGATPITLNYTLVEVLLEE